MLTACYLSQPPLTEVGDILCRVISALLAVGMILCVIAIACLAVGIPVVDFVIPMGELFFIPTVYFIALSEAYFMTKLLQYEEAENQIY